MDWLNLSSPKMPLPHRSYSSAALSKRSPKRSSAQLDKEEEFVIVITTFVTIALIQFLVQLWWYLQRKAHNTNSNSWNLETFHVFFLCRHQKAVKWYCNRTEITKIIHVIFSYVQAWSPVSGLVIMWYFLVSFNTLNSFHFLQHKQQNSVYYIIQLFINSNFVLRLACIRYTNMITVLPYSI